MTDKTKNKCKKCADKDVTINALRLIIIAKDGEYTKAIRQIDNLERENRNLYRMLEAK